MNFNDNEHEDDAIFDNDTITKKYEEITKQSTYFETYKKYILWRNYMKSPICDLKRNAVGDKKGWDGYLEIYIIIIFVIVLEKYAQKMVLIKYVNYISIKM